jgi:hypothetical protein
MTEPVACHSGYDYAERPTAINQDGRWIEIETILAEWRTPTQKGFRVKLRDERLFRLIYDHALDAWDVMEI